MLLEKRDTILSTLNAKKSYIVYRTFGEKDVHEVMKKYKVLVLANGSIVMCLLQIIKT